MQVTQEQVDQYVAETLQPLADELTEYSKGKNIPAPDFYMACVGITREMLVRIGGRKAELLVEELNGILGAWCTEELRFRMEETKDVAE
jgi:hypothetical protein